MNRRGSVMIGVVLMAIYIIAGITFVNFIKDDISVARNANNLDCSNASGISDGNKLTCLIVDISVVYIFIVIISVGGAFITSKMFT